MRIDLVEFANEVIHGNGLGDILSNWSMETISVAPFPGISSEADPRYSPCPEVEISLPEEISDCSFALLVEWEVIPYGDDELIDGEAELIYLENLRFLVHGPVQDIKSLEKFFSMNITYRYPIALLMADRYDFQIQTFDKCIIFCYDREGFLLVRNKENSKPFNLQI